MIRNDWLEKFEFQIILFTISKLISYHSKSISVLVAILSVLCSLYLFFKNENEASVGYLFSVLEFDSFVSAQNAIEFLIPIYFVSYIYKHKVFFGGGEKRLMFYLFFLYWIVFGCVYYINFTFKIDYYIYAFITLKHILVVLLFFAIFQQGVNEDKLEKTLMALVISYIIFVFYSIVFSFKSLKMDSMGVGYSSQVFLFEFILVFRILFNVEALRNKFIFIVVLIILNLLMVKTNTISSQNLIVILCVLLFMDFNLKNLVYSVLISLLSLYIYSEYESLRDYFGDNSIKIDNIFHSIDSFNDIYMIPHSFQVRLIEIENIFKQLNLFELSFGMGVGGYFTDISSNFIFLNEFDFSSDEISSGVYFMPHNISNTILKLGCFFTVITYVLTRKTRSEKKYLYYALYSFSILNFGFTVFPSTILGIVLARICHDENNIN